MRLELELHVASPWHQRNLVCAGRGPNSGAFRVLRGGSWPSGVRCASRGYVTPGSRPYDGGFRLVLE